MSKEKEIRETLTGMAKLSISTNTLNEIHIKNLKAYPYVFFNGVKAVQIDYNLHTDSKIDYETDKKSFEIKYNINKPDTSHFFIKYSLQIDETQDNSHLENRFIALENAIRTLFWVGIPLEVYFNGNKMYKSEQDAK